MASLCPIKEKELGHIDQQLGLTLISGFEPTFCSSINPCIFIILQRVQCSLVVVMLDSPIMHGAHNYYCAVESEVLAYCVMTRAY